MSKIITDPKTGKAYEFKKIGLGLIPLSRLSNACQDTAHNSCISDFASLIPIFKAKDAKILCCLCSCHHEETP